MTLRVAAARSRGVGAAACRLADAASGIIAGFPPHGSPAMTQKTILNDTHRALGAKMVDFGGWDMPIHYGSQIDEHHLVRSDAGMFDVTHMTVVDLRGEQRARLPAQAGRQLGRQAQGAGQGAVHRMLNPQGGVIDDLIVYYMGEDFFRLVVNAATREKDLAWINEQAARPSASRSPSAPSSA